MIRAVHAVAQIIEQAFRLHEHSLQVFSDFQRERIDAGNTFESLVSQIHDLFRELFSLMPLWIDITQFSPVQSSTDIPEELSIPSQPPTTLSQFFEKNINSISQVQNTYNILYGSHLQGGRDVSSLQKEGRSDHYPVIISKLYDETEKILLSSKNIFTALTSSLPPEYRDIEVTPDTQLRYQPLYPDDKSRELAQGFPESPVRHFQTWTGIATGFQKEIHGGNKYPDMFPQYSPPPAEIHDKPGIFSETMRESVNYSKNIQQSLLKYIQVSEAPGLMPGSPLPSTKSRLSPLEEIVPDRTSASAPLVDAGRPNDIRSAFRSSLAMYQEYGKNLFSSFYRSFIVSGENYPEGAKRTAISPSNLLLNKGMIYENLVAATMREFPLQPAYLGDKSGMIRQHAPLSPSFVEASPPQKTLPGRIQAPDEGRRSQVDKQLGDFTRRTGVVEIPTIFTSRREIPRVTPPDLSRHIPTQEIKHPGRVSPSALHEIPQFPAIDGRHSVDDRGPGLSPIMNLISTMATFQNQMAKQGYPELNSWLANPLLQSLHSLVHEQGGPFEDILGNVNAPLLTTGGEIILPGIFQYGEPFSPAHGASSLQATIPMLVNLGRDQVTQFSAMSLNSPPPLRTPVIAVRDTGTSQQTHTNTIHIQNTFNIAVKVSDSTSEGELRDLGRKIGLILADEMKRYGGAP